VVARDTWLASETWPDARNGIGDEGDDFASPG